MKNPDYLLDKMLCAAGAVGIAYSSLFLLGNLGAIIPYVDSSIFPSIKLGIALFLLLTTVTACYYYLLINFVKSVKKQSLERLMVIGAICIGSAVIAINLGVGLYVVIGDYLRDVHGINWYFMDASGWDATRIIALTPILSAAFYFSVMKILRKG